MSIIGTGIDLVDVPSFSRQLDVPGTTLTDGTFTRLELEDGAAAARSAPADPRARSRRLAGRFAAKEAFTKAWASAGHGAPPVLTRIPWQEIEVLNDPWGRPSLFLHGTVAEAVESSIGVVEVNLSISHDGDSAIAMVVIDAP